MIARAARFVKRWRWTIAGCVLLPVVLVAGLILRVLFIKWAVAL